MKQSSTQQPGNQEPENRLAPVLDAGIARKRKRTFLQWLTSFIVSDDGTSIIEQIKKDAKDTAKDLAFSSIKTIGGGFEDMAGRAIFKDEYSKKKNHGMNQTSGYFNYGGLYYPTVTSMLSSSTINTTQPSPAQATNPKWIIDGYALTPLHDFKDPKTGQIIPGDPTGIEAGKVSAGLVQACRDKNFATVQDFFDLINKSWDYTAIGWGWEELTPNICYISRENGWWVLNVPDPKPLNRR
jgi:hypothetical protein